jgi:hypothetical protein
MSHHAHAALFGIGIPVCLLFAGSIVLFLKGRTASSSFQLLGAAGLVLVVLSHLAEAFGLLPGMHWGLEYGAGHYLNLGSTVLALTLFPLGYLIHALTA